VKDRTLNPQLYELSRAIPARLIEKAPQGKFGNYVPHFVVVQILLATVGPYDWQLVEVLRGSVPGITTKDGREWPPLQDAVVGAVYRLTCTIDGEQVTIEEIGVADGPAFENNDAGRLKKAASDAMKRCGMRLGIGIQLWCKRPDQFFLNNVLRGDEDVAVPEAEIIGGEEDDEAHTALVLVDDGEHLPVSEVLDELDAEIVMSEADEQWAALLALCDSTINPRDNKDHLKKLIATMYRVSAEVGWPDDALAKAIAREDGISSLDDMSKDHLLSFARRTQDWLRKAVSEASKED